MTDIIIQIERKRYDESHWVRPCTNPKSNTETQYRVLFAGSEIGVWRDPECSAARYLIDNGFASRDDVLRTYRGDTPCLSGSIGWFAGHRVEESDRSGRDGRPRFAKWRPHPFALRRGEEEKPTSSEEGGTCL